MHRPRSTIALALTAGLVAVSPAAADRSPFPHSFHHNMGYCAPYLAALDLPDGSPVRPFINHTLRDLTSGGTFEGQRNVGDVYSDRARSDVDQQCLPR